MVLTRINNNISALNASRNLNQTSNQLGRSLERLSSGLRINRAADDAAGLSISESQRAQIRGLGRAVQNAQDAISLVNTAEGALNESTVRLQRIRELAVQASNTGGNDAAAIQAAQDEIEQSIAEINRIAETTQFGTRKILNGSVAATATIQAGTANGAVIANSPVASTLSNGTHVLEITQTATGSQTLASGTDGVQNIGVNNVTNSTFDTGSYNLIVSNADQGAAQVLDTSAVATGVQAQVLDSAEFTTGGGAAAGATNVTGTSFGGTAVSDGDTLTISGTDAAGNAVAFTINIAGATTLTNVLSGINGNFSGATATLAADGSIRLTDDTGGASTTTLNISLAGGGSFDDTATVLTTGLNGTAATSTTSLVGTQYLGNTLASGDQVDITGTNAAGSGVTASYVVNGSSTLQDLVDAISAAFSGSTASIDTDGSILLTDDTAAAGSTTALNLTLTGGGGNESASLTTTGAAAGTSAVISLAGGPAQTVNVGDTVTLQGATGTDGLVPEITLTITGTLSNGTDSLSIVQDEFSATLNGGAAVSFQNGDKGVRFIAGSGAGTPAGESVTLDFDTAVTAGTTLIDGQNDGLYFQIGANAGQGVTVTIGDLTAANLGFASQTGRAVSDINVTSFTGAQDAISVIDEALAQVSRQRSSLGAATNRLESTISNLGVAQENLSASESRIRDADIAYETTIFTRNQILVQAGVSILSQANSAPQAVLQLLG